MAEMIPAAPPANAHPFEKDLFEKFKRAPANWKIYPQFFVETFPVTLGRESSISLY